MVREQHDGGLFGPNRKKNAGPMTVIGDGGDGSEAGTVATTGPRYIYKKNEELALDWEDVMIEQELVAKMVHLLESVPEEAGAEIGEAELDSEFMVYIDWVFTRFKLF